MSEVNQGLIKDASIRTKKIHQKKENERSKK
jgi:hypothetical protein